MRKRVIPIIFIFVCTSIAWIILGSVTTLRTYSQDVKLKGMVGQLWGTIQKQKAPYVYYQTKTEKEIKTTRGAETIMEKKVEITDHPVLLDNSDITVGLKLDHRKKGLLWYSTYRVIYSGKYRIVNSLNENRDIFFNYTFPAPEGVYDNFYFVVDGEKVKEIQPTSGKILKKISFDPGEVKNIEIAYESQGIDEWWYIFGADVSQIQNFKLTMVTDFNKI
ncbi:MAG: hypothetical protein QME07_04145, partial [bacterium]|nr:hypothetical protein [bacterium]